MFPRLSPLFKTLIPVRSEISFAINKGKFIFVLVGFTGTIIDITERRLAEEELRKTKDHLDNIIESSIDSIVVSDSEGKIIRVNRAFLELSGYKKEEIIGHDYRAPTEIECYECNGTGKI